jgi:hypothetical protein
MTKAETKQVQRATAAGRGALLRTLAVLHRSGSARTQREIETMIADAYAADEFVTRNGALLHDSEL